MTTEIFFNACDEIVKNKSVLNVAKTMDVFYKQDSTTKTAEDFDDDFNDDFSETVGTGEIKESEDFEDDFAEYATEGDFLCERELGGDVGNNSTRKTFSIQSRQIELPEQNSDGFTVEQEILDFLTQHGFVSEAALNLVMKWNEVYHDTVTADVQVIEKYLKVVYGLWFTDVMVMNEALEVGMDFIHRLRMDYRVCTLGDVRFLKRVYMKPWYNSEWVNEFSLETSYVPQLLNLMEKDSDDVDAIREHTKLLDKYRDRENALLCCIRLLNADKFVYGEFNHAVEAGEVLGYTELALSNDVDKLKVISHRKDYEDLKVSFGKIESNGGIIDPGVLEEYKDAFYLDTIIHVDSVGMLNDTFAHKYLMDDLAQLGFIADLYREGKVDVNIDPSNFMFSKILTDVRNYGLPIEQFQAIKGVRGLSCLVCSHFAGELNEIDYKRFLVALAFSDSTFVIDELSAREELLLQYNQFWFETLMKKAGLLCSIPSNVGDNLVYIKYIDGRRRKYYLQVDNFVLNPESVIELLREASFAQLLKQHNGVVISNFAPPLKVDVSVNVPSSITTWAMHSLDESLYEQFGRHESILKSNLLMAMNNANDRLKRQGYMGVKLSKSIHEFLEMPLPVYSNYDKMFGYIANRPEFLGIFISKRASLLLKLFTNVFVYGSVPKVMFMFLFAIFERLYREKFILDSHEFATLDLNKSVLIINTASGNSVINYRTLSDSIDNFIDMGGSADQVGLRVSDKTINLQFR